MPRLFKSADDNGYSAKIAYKLTRSFKNRDRDARYLKSNPNFRESPYLMRFKDRLDALSSEESTVPNDIEFSENTRRTISRSKRACNDDKIAKRLAPGAPKKLKVTYDKHASRSDANLSVRRELFYSDCDGDIETNDLY
jgi:hypothetical protein